MWFMWFEESAYATLLKIDDTIDDTIGNFDYNVLNEE
jgi:hypothetical protein